MNGLLTAVIVYLILNVMAWTLRHITVSRARRQSAAIDSRYPTDTEAVWPRVSLLVAGKNEEKNIERCLRSLVGQSYPNLEVIAINDRSTDRTGAIMDRVAAESHGRLTAVHITDLPDGWLGKPHAMHEGQKRATGEYLVFTDADCFFQCPDAVRIAVAFAQKNKVDLLSVLPVLETSSIWERILQPVCSAVLIIWFQPERVNNPSCRTAYANGAFMLFSRACYEAVGGHPQVKTFLMEDMEFAKRAKEAGQRLYVVQNRDLYRTRMYEDFRTTFAGWSRIFYGSFRRPLYIVGAALVLLFMTLLPYLILLGALGVATVTGWNVHRLGWFILAWSGLAIAAQLSVVLRFYPLMGSKWYRAFTYPVGASVTLAILLNSLTKFRGGKIVWRGSQVQMPGI